MRTITITVQEDLKHPTPSGIGEHPEVFLNPNIAMRTDDMAGLTILAYLKAADRFCDDHKLCNDCPAFILHNSARFRIRALLKEMGAIK